jgi:hypothetical protein
MSSAVFATPIPQRWDNHRHGSKRVDRRGDALGRTPAKQVGDLLRDEVPFFLAEARHGSGHDESERSKAHLGGVGHAAVGRLGFRSGQPLGTDSEGYRQLQ